MTVTAPINPNNAQPFGVSNFSICGIENGGGELDEDLVLVKQDIEGAALSGVGFTLGTGAEIFTTEGELTFEGLAEGTFTLTETSNPDENCETGGTLTVDVSAEGVITVSDDDETDGLAIVSFDSTTNTVVVSNDCENGGEGDMVTVSIMKHLCNDVSTVPEFEAVEDAGAGGQPGGDGTIPGLVATVLACPTIVLTGDVPTEGAITNGNVDFDFTVIDADGTQLLSEDGMFEQAALCEDDVNLDADGDGSIEADVCLDTSHYMFEVVDGTVVITETQDPEGSTGLGTIRFTPGSEDETALKTSIDAVEATGVIRLDTSKASETALSDGMIMIHAYNFAAGENGGEGDMVTVSIMKHLCNDVSTVPEFEAVEDAGAGGQPGGDGTIPGLVATVLACPTIVLTGDVPTEGAITNGNVDFDFTVIDADGTQLLSEDGMFEQAALCEDDVNLDADGDGSIEADVCLDTSHYMFEVVDGTVVITETQDPEGSTGLGTIRFTPGSEDETALKTSIDAVEATGVIRLDTSKASETALSDGMIMIHAYNFAAGENGGEGDMVTVSIMKHLCNDVSTVPEFEAVEDAGAGGQPGGDGTIPGLVATVLACPTIVLTGDVPTEGAITNGNVDFDFTVIDADGTQLLSEDGMFEQAALCEDDVNLDADGDGSIEADVCLDTSHYMFEVVDGTVVITETQDPEGSTGLGTIRFTPGSEDETALKTSIDAVEATGVIRLDTSKASETALSDGMIMIHAYNFAAAGEGPAQGTRGGNPAGTGGLPNTAAALVSESMPPALLALFAIAGLACAACANVAAVRARRR